MGIQRLERVASGAGDAVQVFSDAKKTMQVSWECSSDPDVATLELRHKHCPHVARELMLLVNRTDNDCWMDSNLACEGNDIDFVINRNWSVSHNQHHHYHSPLPPPLPSTPPPSLPPPIWSVSHQLH